MRPGTRPAAARSPLQRKLPLLRVAALPVAMPVNTGGMIMGTGRYKNHEKSSSLYYYCM